MTKTMETKVKRAIAKAAHISNVDCVEIVCVNDDPELLGAIAITANADDRAWEALYENGKVYEVNQIEI